MEFPVSENWEEADVERFSLKMIGEMKLKINVVSLSKTNAVSCLATCCFIMQSVSSYDVSRKFVRLYHPVAVMLSPMARRQYSGDTFPSRISIQIDITWTKNSRRFM